MEKLYNNVRDNYLFLAYNYDTAKNIVLKYYSSQNKKPDEKAASILMKIISPESHLQEKIDVLSSPVSLLPQAQFLLNELRNPKKSTSRVLVFGNLAKDK